MTANRRASNLVDGHLRVDLAQAQDEPTVPVVYVDLSEAEAEQLEALLDGLDPSGEGLRVMLDELEWGPGTAV